LVEHEKHHLLTGSQLAVARGVRRLASPALGLGKITSRAQASVTKAKLNHGTTMNPHQKIAE